MLNKPKNNKIGESFNFLSKENCNFLSKDSLLEAGDKLNNIKYQIKPASPNFHEELKNKIMAKRRKGSAMNFNFNWFPKFSPKIFVPITAGFLVVVVIATTIFYPWTKGGVMDNFSRLLIEPAYANDNFVVEATNSDALGVESNTAFIIKSKSVIDADDLKNNIVLKPNVDFLFKKISDFEFKVIPKIALEGKKVYNLEIKSSFIDSKGLKVERDYSWAFEVKDIFKVYNTLPADKTNGIPLDSGIEVTFSHSNFTNFEEAFSIEPSTKGKFEKHNRTMVFVPEKLIPETIYTIKIDKNKLILDGSENKLENDLVFKFETAEEGNNRFDYYYSNFWLNEDWNEFAPNQEPVFQVSTNYLKENEKIITKVYQFTDENKFISSLVEKEKIPYWALYTRDSYLTKTDGLKEVMNVNDLTIKKFNYNNYFILPNSLPKGYYLVEFRLKDFVRQSFFEVTNLAFYSSVTKNNTLVWLNDLENGKPIKEASLKIFGTEISKISNEKGITIFNTESVFGDFKKIDYTKKYIIANSGEDRAVFPVTVNNYYNILNDRMEVASQYWFYSYLDRSDYQPDDKIKFWGFVKPRQENDLNLQEITVEASDTSYNSNYYSDKLPTAETKVKVNADGFFSGELTLNKALAGYYTLTFKQGEKTFEEKYFWVRKYIKPAYKLEIIPEKTYFYAGKEKLPVKVKASFYDGTPVPNLDLNFSNPENTYQITTDELGEAKAEIEKKYDCKDIDDYCDFPSSVYANVSPVESENGAISAQTYVMSFGSDINLDVNFNKKDKEPAKIVFKVNKIDTSKANEGYYFDYIGDPLAGVNFQATIIETSYKQIEDGEYYDFINKTVNKKYIYENVEKVLAIYDGVTGSDGQNVYELKTEPNKSYRVKTVAKDSEGRMSIKIAYLYDFGYGYYGEGYGQDNYNLVFKKQTENNVTPTFSANEQVELIFNKNGKAIDGYKENSFLYYKMQNGLLDYEINSEPFYNFEFKREYIPNIDVKAVWFDGKTYHTTVSGWWYNNSSLKVFYDIQNAKLKVSVEADKKEYKPGDSVKLNLKVTDKNNNPVKSEINLNLVDEAYYGMGGYTDFSPLESLYSALDSGELVSYNSHKEIKLSLTGGAEGGGCFLAGTMIKMADGKQKKIEDIKEGDKILTLDNPKDATLVSAKVIKKFVHNVSDYLIINDNLKVTPEHRVFLNNGWQMIGEAKIGDQLLNSKGQYVEIRNIEWKREKVVVYNFLVENYHTYLANDFYVHNDKGGVRTNFQDVALFNSVKTDNKGLASISFNLPDNITSWRVNALAIGNGITAGAENINLKVSLPVFVEANISSEYLSTDKPEIKVRAYGTKLKKDEKVIYTVDIPDFGLKNSKKEGKAFESKYFSLSQLKAGDYQAKIKVSSSKDDDTIIKPIKIVDSRLKENTQDFYKLAENLEIKGSADSLTTLIFSDENQGKFYWDLYSLSFDFGDRADQKISRLVSQKLLEKYFGEKNENSEYYDFNAYQFTGGIRLLPYSDIDLELTAKMALLAPEYFDQSALADYLYNKVDDRLSTKEEVAWSLIGLAGLKKPVISQIHSFSKLELNTKEKILVALAASELGDKEFARKIYLSIMKDNGEKLNAYIRIKVSDNQDEILESTVLTALLAGELGDEFHSKLWQYVVENYPKEKLINLEKLMYISLTLPSLKSGEVSFSVIVGDKVIDKVLKNGNLYRLSLTPKQLATAKFSGIKGNIGLNVNYEIPLKTDQIKSDNLVSLKREYYVKKRSNEKITNFKEGDFVEVRLYPSFDKSVPWNYYQINDILPSGLEAISGIFDYSNQVQDGCYIYPYEINGKVVKFLIPQDFDNNYYCKNNYISYLARIVSTGDFTAEPALIQSVDSVSIKAYSKDDIVKIEKNVK